MMSDIKRYDPGTDFCTDMDQIKDGDYVLYADHIEAVVLKDARIDWVVKDNAKKAIEITTMREALDRKTTALKRVNEDVRQYQNVLADMAIELCAAMGCDVEKYETDQAEYECYRDCFRDAAKQLATMREALEYYADLGEDVAIKALKALKALEKDDE